MLKTIEINNYKLFKEFRIDFSEGINLICGPNGSGKSALRELLYALTDFLAMPDVSDHVAHSVSESFPTEVFCRWLPHETGSDDIDICMEIGDESSWFRYCLTIRYNFRDHKTRVQKESLEFIVQERKDIIFSFSDGTIDVLTDDGRQLVFNTDWSMSGLVAASRNNSKIRRFGEMVSKLFAVKIEPEAISQDFKGESRTLGVNGERFPGWHFYHTTNHSEKQSFLIEQCKNFIPGFVSVNSPLSGDFFRWKVRVKYLGRSFDLAFRELSDGQKTLFALYSLLTNVPEGATVFIDEPENFLAPGELQPWLDVLHDVWEERNIQWIMISHNPKTLNWHHKEAIIFSIEGEPPQIVVKKNNNNASGSLYSKISEMEWTGYVAES